jgi:hypothetical protein
VVGIFLAFTLVIRPESALLHVFHSTWFKVKRDPKKLLSGSVLLPVENTIVCSSPSVGFLFVPTLYGASIAK